MRFGFVGLGRATQVFHLPALERVSGVEVVGGVDPSADRAEAWREAGRTAFESVEQLLAEAQPEVVVVATPPDSHADICVEALEGGAHVICEKPFAMSVEEADRVLAAADATGRRVAVNLEFREKPILKSVKERVDSGDAGRLVFAQIWQLMDMAPWQEKTPWRTQMATRTLLEGGVHLVDLLLQLYGELPEAVYARRSAGFHDQEEADPIHLVILEFSGGRLGQVMIDRLCQAGTSYLELRADCEQESLRASLGGRAAVQIGKKRAQAAGVRLDFGLGGLSWIEKAQRRRTLARASRNFGVDATAALLQRIVDALRAGEEPPSSGREARDGLVVIEAAYESAATGMRIELAPRFAAVPA